MNEDRIFGVSPNITYLPMLRPPGLARRSGGFNTFWIESKSAHKSSSLPGNMEYDDYEFPPAIHPFMEGKYLKFRPFIGKERPQAKVHQGYFFKMHGRDVNLIRWSLEDNGLRESKKDWSIMWSTCALKSEIYRSLTRFQKVNHFPRSFEITKKDCLFKNISKMKSLHGPKHYNFIPQTFILPQDAEELENEMDKDTSVLWIVKPAAGSQGKGIYVIKSSADIPHGLNHMVVSRYIDNPFLINGLKFDLRIYVAITSMNPLRMYIYKEGLVRFATEEYNNRDISNRYAHLTNYSVNKYSPSFVVGEDEGKGSKWSLGGLIAYLNERDIDFLPIWQKIKDIAIKTILSIEPLVNAAMDMYVPHRYNCFELLGFDILIDEDLNPWLLEVNLSPSMNIETPLDKKIKSVMIAELFTLIGIPIKKSNNTTLKKVHKPAWNQPSGRRENELSAEQLRIIRETNNELQRSGSFERIYPCEFSCNYYRQFNSSPALQSSFLTSFMSLSHSQGGSPLMKVVNIKQIYHKRQEKKPRNITPGFRRSSKGPESTVQLMYESSFKRGLNDSIKGFTGVIGIR